MVRFRVPITRGLDLQSVADGQRIAVEGRYERWSPDLAPPGVAPLSARVVLEDRSGVLIGRYREPESRRPDDELAGLGGAIVRVSGAYFHTREWPSPGPMPGLWTGGGPQLVGVDSVEVIEPARPPPSPPEAH